MSEERSAYLSYVLRLWQSSREDQSWHASLTDPVSGERYGFGSLEALFSYLCEQTQRRSVCHSDGQVGDGGAEQ